MAVGADEMARLQGELLMDLCNARWIEEQAWKSNQVDADMVQVRRSQKRQAETEKRQVDAEAARRMEVLRRSSYLWSMGNGSP